jgi:hypothetical protein
MDCSRHRREVAAVTPVSTESPDRQMPSPPDANGRAVRGNARVSRQQPDARDGIRRGERHDG